MAFGAGKTHYSGTGKPVPYMVPAKILHQISTIAAYSDPSVSFADSSPYAGEPMQGCRQHFPVGLRQLLLA